GSGDISGDITAEMLFSGTKGVTGSWIHVCSPLSGNTLSDLEDDMYLDYTTNPITKLSAYEYDETLTGTGNIITKSVWKPATAATNISENGVLAWVPNANVWGVQNAINTLDVTGGYTKGDLIYNGLTNTGGVMDTSGWHLVANPWPSGYNHHGQTITNANA